jgi:hypothetical protein
VDSGCEHQLAAVEVPDVLFGEWSGAELAVGCCGVISIFSKQLVFVL